MAVHEELKNRAAQGLAALNAVIAINGNGTDWGSTTTVATYQAVNNTRKVVATIHETDRQAIYDINNRNVETLNAMGIFTNTEITAFNSTSTGEAGFTDDDPSLPAAFAGSRGF